MKILTCFLSLLLLVSGCHSAKNDEEKTNLTKLQAALDAKTDSLVLLTAQLNSRPVVENTIEDGIHVQEVTVMEENTTPSDETTVYKLYQKPVIKEIQNFEFAEVISSTDTVATFRTDDFSVTAVSVCNGPADPDLDYCNCSNFVYVVTATLGEASEYRLFKLGPFSLPEFKGWKMDKDKPVLMIEHDVKDKKRTNTFRITLSGIRQL